MTNECPFNGSKEIVILDHMSGVLVPKKCLSCSFNEEGECPFISNKYRRLDFGGCGIEGSVTPILIENADFPIPEKCLSCKYLLRFPLRNIIYCTKDLPNNRVYGRGLDYGISDIT